MFCLFYSKDRYVYFLFLHKNLSSPNIGSTHFFHFLSYFSQDSRTKTPITYKIISVFLLLTCWILCYFQVYLISLASCASMLLVKFLLVICVLHVHVIGKREDFIVVIPWSIPVSVTRLFVEVFVLSWSRNFICLLPVLWS